MIRGRYRNTYSYTDDERRVVLKTLGVVIGVAAVGTSAALRPLNALGAEQGHPWPEAALAQTKLDEAIRLGVGTMSMEEAHVTVGLPPVAENGAVVPVTVACDLNNVDTLHIVVDKNPEPYICRYYVGDSGRAEISTRIKMGETSDVRGIAVTKDGKVYMGKNNVRVVTGGCGA